MEIEVTLRNIISNQYEDCNREVETIENHDGEVFVRIEETYGSTFLNEENLMQLLELIKKHEEIRDNAKT